MKLEEKDYKQDNNINEIKEFSFKFDNIEIKATPDEICDKLHDDTLKELIKNIDTDDKEHHKQIVAILNRYFNEVIVKEKMVITNKKNKLSFEERVRLANEFYENYQNFIVRTPWKDYNFTMKGKDIILLRRTKSRCLLALVIMIFFSKEMILTIPLLYILCNFLYCLMLFSVIQLLFRAFQLFMEEE